MPRKSKEQLRMERLQASMLPLCAYPEFETFMEMVRLIRDEAVALSVDFEGIKSERAALVLKGEVRCYLNLIAFYDGQKDQYEQLKAQTEAELAAQRQQG